MQLLLKKVTILHPGSTHHGSKKDIYIRNGLIEKIGSRIDAPAKTKVLDERNTFVSAGWLDPFADFSDPGQEQKETLHSGMETAAAGGYTDVMLMPDNQPVTGNKSSVEYLKNYGQLVNLHPIGALSKNTDGKDLAEMLDMREAGAIAFSDGKKSVQSGGLFMKALQYVKKFDGVAISIPEESSIAANGLMHEGNTSTRIGLQGKPGIAEHIQVYRDIEILRYTGSRLHLTGISTARSIELIRAAKKQKLQLSCSVSPAHLLYTEDNLSGYDSIYKVHPPLRTETDRQALIKALHDGTIDCVASHHSPQHWDDKQVEFEYARNGMISLQTMLNFLLHPSLSLTPERCAALLGHNAREIFGLPLPRFENGAQACLTIFNTEKQWDYNKDSNTSLSHNSPLFNTTLRGKVTGIVNNLQYRIYE